MNLAKTRFAIQNQDLEYYQEASKIFSEFNKTGQFSSSSIIHYGVLAHLCQMLFGHQSECTRMNFDFLIVLGYLKPVDQTYPFMFFIIEGIEQVKLLLRENAKVANILPNLKDLEKHYAKEIRAFTKKLKKYELRVKNWNKVYIEAEELGINCKYLKIETIRKKIRAVKKTQRQIAKDYKKSPFDPFSSSSAIRIYKPLPKEKKRYIESVGFEKNKLGNIKKKSYYGLLYKGSK